MIVPGEKELRAPLISLTASSKRGRQKRRIIDAAGSWIVGGRVNRIRKRKLNAIKWVADGHERI